MKTKMSLLPIILLIIGSSFSSFAKFQVIKDDDTTYEFSYLNDVGESDSYRVDHKGSSLVFSSKALKKLAMLAKMLSEENMYDTTNEIAAYSFAKKECSKTTIVADIVLPERDRILFKSYGLFSAPEFVCLSEYLSVLVPSLRKYIAINENGNQYYKYDSQKQEFVKGGNDKCKLVYKFYDLPTSEKLKSIEKRILAGEGVKQELVHIEQSECKMLEYNNVAGEYFKVGAGPLTGKFLKDINEAELRARIMESGGQLLLEDPWDLIVHDCRCYESGAYENRVQKLCEDQGFNFHSFHIHLHPNMLLGCFDGSVTLSQCKTCALRMIDPSLNDLKYYKENGFEWFMIFAFADPNNDDRMVARIININELLEMLDPVAGMLNRLYEMQENQEHKKEEEFSQAKKQLTETTEKLLKQGYSRALIFRVLSAYGKINPKIDPKHVSNWCGVGKL